MVRTASPMREAHLYPPHLPFPKHRPIVENGTFSTGPFVRNRREPRSGRPREAPPTQAACIRGVRGPARRMDTSPAPGSLWFLSPAGKELVRPQTHETLTSCILSLVRVPPPLCLPTKNIPFAADRAAATLRRGGTEPLRPLREHLPFQGRLLVRRLIPLAVQKTSAEASPALCAVFFLSSSYVPNIAHPALPCSLR